MNAKIIAAVFHDMIWTLLHEMERMAGDTGYWQETFSNFISARRQG